MTQLQQDANIKTRRVGPILTTVKAVIEGANSVVRCASFLTNHGSVMVKPWEFLERWVREHVKATHDDEATKRKEARKLVERCLRDAKEAGVDKVALIKAAGNDLFIFLLTGLDGAAPAVEKID